MNLRYERNPDGSFKAIFVVTPEGEIPLEFEVNPDGTYKVIYSTAIGNVYLDQFIQSLANENAKIRYNSQTNTWQYTTDGQIWYDFGSGGGSGTDEKVKATSTDPQAGYLNEKIDDNHFEIVDNKLKIKTGKVGTKEVDETDIGNDKILVYNSTTDKLEYQTKPSGGSSEPYLVSYAEYKKTSQSGNYISPVFLVPIPTISKVNLTASYTGSSIVHKLQKLSSTGITEVLAFYKFEQNYIDTSGNQPNLTPVNSPTFVEGHSGYAISFDETYEQYCYLPSNQQNNLYLTGSFSVGCWIYLPDFPSHNAGIISRERVDPTRDGFDLLFNSSTYEIRFEYWKQGEMLVLGVSADTMTWFFIVAIVDFSENKLKIYKNGEKISETSITSAYPQFDDDLCIGNLKHWSGHFITGSIDEAFIVNRALTDTEILDIYQNGLTLMTIISETTLSLGENNVNITNDTNNFRYTISGANLRFQGFKLEMK